MERSRHVQPDRYTDTPETRAQTWIATHGATFAQQLSAIAAKTHLKAVAGKERGTSSIPPDLFDHDTHRLEEMPVCAFWAEWASSNPLPRGFALVRGSVLMANPMFLDDRTQSRRVDHMYLAPLDGSEVVLDHCAAQFYRRRPNPEIKKGERLDELKDLAGDLFTPITTGNGPSHWFLLGRKSTIAERTGMIYDNFGRLGE